MHFFKYHGTGNDFVCIDNQKGNISLSANQIQFLCDRHFGIGADGVILMEKSQNGGDIFMNYYNADGTTAEMCGNGVRVTARFAVERWKNMQKEILVDTRSGIKPVFVLENHFYQVNMGIPKFLSADFPEKSQEIFGQEWHFASMGNPHAIGFFGDETSMNKYFSLYAGKIESLTELFPKKINVNFVVKRGAQHFFVKTYERGAGPTLACGTGASGSFAWILKKFPECVEKKVQLDIPGGVLLFEMSAKGEVLMSGPAELVFEGEIENIRI
ncbi:MAG: diaminopimelate epimerase [Candidatus Peregrinibacteria bacterium]